MEGVCLEGRYQCQLLSTLFTETRSLTELGACSKLLFVYKINTMTTTWEGKDVFHPRVPPNNNSLLKEIRSRTQGTNLEIRTEAEAWRILFSGQLSTIHSSAF